MYVRTYVCVWVLHSLSQIGYYMQCLRCFPYVLGQVGWLIFSIFRAAIRTLEMWRYVCTYVRTCCTCMNVLVCVHAEWMNGHNFVWGLALVNIIMVDLATALYCVALVSHFSQVLHWNSPLKLRVAHRHAHVFKNHYLTFQEYNGELLRCDWCGCEGWGGGSTRVCTDTYSTAWCCSVKMDWCFTAWAWHCTELIDFQ